VLSHWLALLFCSWWPFKKNSPDISLECKSFQLLQQILLTHVGNRMMILMLIDVNLLMLMFIINVDDVLLA
jgi:hypothetical protein